MERQSELGTVKALSLIHIYHYESVLGPRRAEAISPLASTWERGIPFTLHQDSPVVPPDILAVSYTHLDVYKRQTYGCHSSLSSFHGMYRGCVLANFCISLPRVPVYGSLNTAVCFSKWGPFLQTLCTGAAAPQCRQGEHSPEG